MKSLKEQIEEAIDHSTQSKINKFRKSRQLAKDEWNRSRRRSQHSSSGQFAYEPPWTDLEDLYNPYHVRTNRSGIAHAIAEKIRSRTYQPKAPILKKIKKKSGGERTVATFNIADEAVSHLVMSSITRKNLQRLGSNSYAYLPDRGPHDAIWKISSSFNHHKRIYVAEFDFKDFFGTIRHSAIKEALAQTGLLTTPVEDFLIRTFLAASSDKKEGLIQGTSVSVLLANIVALEIDRGFEQLGIDYVRYADDTLAWSSRYDQLVQGVDWIYKVADKIGTSVNEQKSPGVRLLVQNQEQNAEISSTTSVTYLGHDIGLSQTRLSKSVVTRIKSDINKILYVNLLKEPRRGNQSRDRFSQMDKDYVTAIWQLRRYIYGSYSEHEIQRFSRSSRPPVNFSGMVSFYPLARDQSQWEHLDDWLFSQLRLVLAKRYKMLASSNEPELRNLMSVWNGQPLKALKSQQALSPLSVKSTSTGQMVDLSVPSFQAIHNLVYAAVQQHGFKVVSGQGGSFLYNP